jgi:hypothetical protein
MLLYSGTKCLECDSVLKFEDSKSSVVTIYGLNGSKDHLHQVKVCPQKNCRAHFHYTFFTKKGVFFKERRLAKFFYDAAATKTIFMSSNSTGFEIKILESLMTDMMLCPEYSFYQKAMAYNLSVPSGNDYLIYKRLLEGFFQFALLKMLGIYDPDMCLSTLLFSHDLDENLLKFTPTLKDLFGKHFAKHRCDVPGCGSVLGWDADCKVSLKHWF